MAKRLILLIFVVLVVVSAVYGLRDQKKVTTDSDKAYKTYMAGQDFLDRLYFRDAVTEFEKAVKIDTNFAMAYARLGSLYYSLYGDKEKAGNMLDKAMTIAPNVKEKERLTIQIMQADIKGNEAEIEKYREEFLTKYPDCLESHRFQADKYFRTMEYDKVINEYEAILKIDPNYAQAYNMLAYVNYYTRNYDEAIDYIKKYVYMASDQANPHDSYGELLMNIGKYDEAINEFKMADKIKPDLYFVLTHLGNVYNSIGRVRDAVGYYLRARDNATNKNEIIKSELNIAAVYWDNLGYERGLKSIEELIAKHPNDLAVLSWYGFALAMNNQVEKTSEVLAKFDSLSTIRLDTMPFTSKGEAKKEIGNVKKLIYGTIALKTANYDKAIADIQTVTDSTSLPSKIWFRCFLSDAYTAAGNYAKARDILMMNLLDNPNHALTLIRLANVYKELKQTDNQKETLLRYLSVMSGADEEVIAVKNARIELNKLLQS
jgi:tetratricopeptide (TPR) repeat protein